MQNEYTLGSHKKQIKEDDTNLVLTKCEADRLSHNTTYITIIDLGFRVSLPL